MAPLSTLEHSKTIFSTLASTLERSKAEVGAPQGVGLYLRPDRMLSGGVGNPAICDTTCCADVNFFNELARCQIEDGHYFVAPPDKDARLILKSL